MYTFRELQKAVKLSVPGVPNRLAVLGNCSTQLFSQAIEGCAKLCGLNLSVYDADYDQIDIQLLDRGSALWEFDPDEVLIWLCTERLYEEFLDSPAAGRVDFAERCVEKLESYWSQVSAHSKARIIQPNFPEIDDRALGQYSLKVESTFIYQLRRLNALLQSAARKNDRVFPVDFLSVQIRMGTEAFYSPKLYFGSKMPASFQALPELARSVVDVIAAMSGRIKKCVILDLDNTLWGGIIGDDGMAGIEIGDLGKGHVYSDLQRWLRELKEYGVILCVCSKNNEEIAKEPFEKHEDMILRLSDFALFVANWDDKASNIKLIQETLNIGMDSIVFLDDNPFERNLVKQRFPDIEAPDLPEDPSLWLRFLQSGNYFETASYAAETNDRTKLYQAEFERKKLESSFDSIDDYLASLQMEGEAKAFEPSKYPRIAQLTQRSNQFNLRTVRYTEDEIRSIAEDLGYLTLYFTLKDRFGEHGLVSVVILKKLDTETLFVDTWLMSCRVLKRSMEEFVVNEIVETAKKNAFKTITAEYLPTPKNMMVRDIYRTMGFEELGEGRYALSVEDYQIRKTFVRKEN